LKKLRIQLWKIRRKLKKQDEARKALEPDQIPSQILVDGMTTGKSDLENPDALTEGEKIMEETQHRELDASFERFLKINSDKN